MIRLTLLFLCLSSYAQVVDHDSLGIFYTDQKATVVIAGLNAHRRLDSFFEAAKAGDYFTLTTWDKSFESKCARNESRATCTMTFTPSTLVTVGLRKMAASLSVSETRIPFPETYDVTFQSANGDVFMISVNGGLIHFSGHKK